MPVNSTRLLEIAGMDSTRAGHQDFKTVDPRFDPERRDEEGFLVEDSNPIGSAEYHVGEGFRGQMQAFSDLQREAAAGNGGGQYFDWPLPASTLEGLLQGSSNNLGAWPAMAAILTSAAQAETSTNVLLANLSVLQQKAQQLEALVQEGLSFEYEMETVAAENDCKCGPNCKCNGCTCHN